MGTRPSVCFRHDAQRPLCRDKLRPVTASRGGALDDPLQLSKNIRCFSKRRRLPSRASSSDPAISEYWPVSSACLTITRWRRNLDRQFGDVPVGLRKMLLFLNAIHEFATDNFLDS